VIDVVTVGARDTVDTLARRMAYTTYQTERFRVLNGLTGGRERAAGPAGEAGRVRHADALR
jgi:predicted Zn-dependent protease